jgi:hypothetical protein
LRFLGNGNLRLARRFAYGFQCESDATRGAEASSEDPHGFNIRWQTTLR